MKYYILFPIITLFLFQSCEPLCYDCEGQPCEYEKSFGFRIIDEGNQNMIASYGAKYDVNLVELTKEDGTTPYLYYKNEGGNIAFTNPPEDQVLEDTNYIRRYFLHFPAVGIIPKHKDTITLQYFATVNCLEDRLIVYYNDSLYRDAPYSNSVGIRFVKK